MSTEIDHGGCAFPAQEKIEYPSSIVMEYRPGMTMRDYFAAQALPSIIQRTVISSSETAHDDIAKLSYSIADSMIKARSLK